MVRYWLLGALILMGQTTSWASIQTDIEAANKGGKTVFLVVTEPGIEGREKALSIAQQAHESATASTVIEMDRADITNKALVDTYRLAGAPLPVIVVVASNGMVTGGIKHDQATAKILTSMIPSPKTMEILEALQARKAVIAVASRTSMPNLNKVLDTSRAACNQLKGGAEAVTIDLDDQKESSLLGRLRVASKATEPVIVVINPQGQVTATLDSSVDADNLVQAATKQVAGGCCPGGGNNTSCGPAR